jgi:calcineurin-like phosphoesterase family protein
MNNRIFIISDTHFGHKRICEFEKDARPFETVEQHDAELVDRWNSVVNKNDTVWHLGDVLFSAASFELLPKLNGVKKLVMGNHDHYNVKRYAEHFSEIFGCVSMRDCIFTHVPIHPNQFYRFKANIHGHMHSNVIDDPRYINVSAEQNNLTPQLLDKVLQKVPK